jgi:DNA polymerase sigma
MWAHKFTSKLILLLDLVQRLSPTTGCCETRRQEVENIRTAWFERFMKLLDKGIMKSRCAGCQVNLEGHELI